eukprot:CAMPEP_0170597470 /NCGR_PEP_ID=MMETSP0224-20130122/15725_1 /TAXON_ID=285029 /ORGANISM="Togula jolla, Strain CCCM 725" /LENGTH=72 /DNA_ID=CAMNT_0010921945 /DNA_START=21 /DNA_END=236 /DNA_ORIENTATION=+
MTAVEVSGHPASTLSCAESRGAGVQLWGLVVIVEANRQLVQPLGHSLGHIRILRPDLGMLSPVVVDVEEAAF